MAALKLFLLGAPRLERDGQRVPLSRRKVMALIAFLAVTRQSHSRAALAALLWPDATRASALNSLRRTLSLANDALDGRIAADRELVCLDAELWVDVAEFRKRGKGCALHHSALSTACDGCLERAAGATALYGGDFMAGFALDESVAFDEWQFFQGEALQREVARLLEGLVLGCRARGAWEAATDAAQRWLAIEPLAERAHRQLIALYAEAGREAAALRQYQSLVRLLDDELGVQPEEESRQLYERIRTGRAARAPRAEPEDAGRAALLLDAWRAALASSDPARIEPLVEALYTFYERKGQYEEGERAFGRAARQLEAAKVDDPGERGRLGRVLSARHALFRLRLGAVAEAQTTLRASLEAAQLEEDEEEIAFALEGLRGAARALGAPTAASPALSPLLGRPTSSATWSAALYPAPPAAARSSARFEEAAEDYAEGAVIDEGIEGANARK